MTLQPDVGHLHATLALSSGAFAALIATGLMADVRFGMRGETIGVALMVTLFVAVWCGVFALVLRGTPVSRAAAGLGLGLTMYSVCTGMCAASIH